MDNHREEFNENAAQGKLAELKTLIKLYPDMDVNWRNPQESQNTALMRAASAGYIETVQWLLQTANADFRTNSYRKSALHLAACNGHDGVVRVLINHGAEKDQKDKYGVTALMLAAREKKDEVVKTLLECGAFVNEQSNAGNTALIEAASAGSESIVQMLLDHGSDITTKDMGGRTALLAGADRGGLSAINVLLRYGANIHERDADGETLFTRTVPLGPFFFFKPRILDMKKVLCYLLDSGVDIDARTRKGYTALHLAVMKKNPRWVRFHLTHGANLYCRIIQEPASTAMLCASKKSRKVVKSLLAAEARIVPFDSFVLS